MSVGLVGWGRFFDAQGNRVTVPAPSTDPGSEWLWDFLTSQAAHLGKAGFTHLLLPPCSKAQGGSGAGCDGYEVYDPRDIGSKNQQGSVNTRYGSAESLRQLVATAHSSGMEVFLDIVLHQLGGGINKTYNYLGADGKTLNGRGALTPECFSPPQPYDDVPAPMYNEGIYAFGDEKTYQHSIPADYTALDAIDAADWLFRTTGADGSRSDDAKGTWPQFLDRFMNSGAMASKAFMSEFFDGNPANLNWWATSAPMNSRSGVEDFTMHWRIQAACNGYDATQLVNGGWGYNQWNSSLAYGFVDNPDTDTSPGQQVMFSKLLGYAWMLTLPMQMAMVYGKDYFPSTVWPGAYGLHKQIDNMVWINRMFAFGAAEVRWVDHDVIAITRDGNGGSTGWSGGLLTVLNFNTFNWRTITVQTPFGPNRQIHDYTGHSPDVWTDGNGRLTVSVPPDAYSSGESYLMLSPAGVDQPIHVQPMRTKQTFFGAADLDTYPARNMDYALPSRVWITAGATINFTLMGDRTGWQENSSVQVILSGPDKAPAGGITLDTTTAVFTTTASTATVTGWHTINVIGNLLPEAGSSFELEIDYAA
jgi:alpha-amylase